MGASPNHHPGIHGGYHHISLSRAAYVDADGNHHPARHIGCTLGRSGHHPDASRMEAAQSAGVFAGVVGAASRAVFGADPAQIDNHFAELTAPADSGSPWPGVKPCDFWAELNADERMEMANAIIDAAITAQYGA